jgi:cytidylate kinase
MSSHTYLDRGLTIFNTRLGAPASGSHPPFSDSGHPFITISREACAGATTLGQHLLPLLDAELAPEGRNWLFLDKNLLTQVLTTNSLPEHLAKFLPEERISEIKAIIGEMVGLHPPLWELEQRVAKGIYQLARRGCVIFAGRAAHLVTQNLRAGFHLRLVAPLETRISRMQELQHCGRADAERALEETDRARERFVLSNFGRDINDPCTYDLVINTERILPATAARLVVDAMLEKARAEAPAAARA